MVVVCRARCRTRRVRPRRRQGERRPGRGRCAAASGLHRAAAAELRAAAHPRGDQVLLGRRQQPARRAEERGRVGARHPRRHRPVLRSPEDRLRVPLRRERRGEGEGRDPAELVAARAFRREDRRDVVPGRRHRRGCARAASAEGKPQRRGQRRRRRSGRAGLGARLRAYLALSSGSARRADDRDRADARGGVRLPRRRVEPAALAIGRPRRAPRGLARSTSRATCSAASFTRRSRSRTRSGRASSRCARSTARSRSASATSSSRAAPGRGSASSGEGDAGLLPGFAAGIMARRAEKQFRKDFERLKRLLETA